MFYVFLTSPILFTCRCAIIVAARWAGRAGPPGQDLVRSPAVTLVLVSDVKQEMSQGKHASCKRSWVARGQNETSLNLKQISINISLLIIM